MQLINKYAYRLSVRMSSNEWIAFWPFPYENCGYAYETDKKILYREIEKIKVYEDRDI